jgi:hypothetical protein
MKVASKLVNMDFAIGKIERKGDYLIILSDPARSSLPAKVRMDAIDIWSFLKAALNRGVISYIFAFPSLYRKAKKGSPAEERAWK